MSSFQFGHGLEKIRQLSHGQAVAAGMMIAARISVKKGLLGNAQLARIETLLKNLRLPTEVPVDRAELMEALKKDKKRQAEGVYFVLLTGIGGTLVEKISFEELEILTEGII